MHPGLVTTQVVCRDLIGIQRDQSQIRSEPAVLKVTVENFPDDHVRMAVPIVDRDHRSHRKLFAWGLRFVRKHPIPIRLGAYHPHQRNKTCFQQVASMEINHDFFGHLRCRCRKS